MSIPSGPHKCSKCNEWMEKTSEDTLTCSACGSSYHAKKCLSYRDPLVSMARTYNWTCGSCKRCEVCLRKRNEKDLILCDSCDRGYHCFCLVPQLWKPPEGSWRCPNCASGSKTNETSPRVMRGVLQGSRRVNEEASEGTVVSHDSVESEPAPKRIRQREAAEEGIGKGSRTPSRKSALPSRIRNRKRIVGTRPVRCRVPGCNGEGHISGRFSRHVYREFCPVYRNMSVEETKELRKKREQLSQANKMPKRTNTIDCEAMIRAVDEERCKLETHLRKRPSVISASSPISPRSTIDREPALSQYISKFDFELFRMAEAALAESMERDASLRNTLTSHNKWLRFGHYDIATWYPSQFPGEFAHLEKLFMCEYCLKFMRCEYQLQRHSLPGRCPRPHPPGDKIYEKGSLAVWEVDGKIDKIYCQNLCLLAMLFLDHKTLFKDVEAFYFYVLTVKEKASENNYHFVAYFSKEKTSTANCNLSCLLTLPPFLRRGYGHFLIDLSYALSKLEGKIGSPEHPLSDMGLKTYRSYWRGKIFDNLSQSAKGSSISIKDISQQTAIHPNDLISTLQYFGIVKYWRGQYWLVKSDSVSVYKKAMQKRKSDPLQAPREIDMSCLTWKRR